MMKIHSQHDYLNPARPSKGTGIEPFQQYYLNPELTRKGTEIGPLQVFVQNAASRKIRQH